MTAVLLAPLVTSMSLDCSVQASPINFPQERTTP